MIPNSNQIFSLTYYQKVITKITQINLLFYFSSTLKIILPLSHNSSYI